jgi:hypothetical protein
VVIAARDGAALARHVGWSPEAVSRVAAGTLIPSATFQVRLEDGLRLWAAGHLRHRRLGRPASQSLDAVWDDLEARSPTWADQERTLRSAQDEARAFSQVPPERRTARLKQRLNAAWRAYHRACRPASLQCWPGEETRSARRQVREMQHAGDLPDVIYRDDDEKLWMPTREQLQLGMISRAEFDAWRPVVAGSPELARFVASLGATPPPPGRRVVYDRSPRLLEFLSALPAMREFRAELQGMRPPGSPGSRNSPGASAAPRR